MLRTNFKKDIDVSRRARLERKSYTHAERERERATNGYFRVADKQQLSDRASRAVPA